MFNKNGTGEIIKDGKKIRKKNRTLSLCFFKDED